jgi:anaerobic selenocysteine-containing dehydrogenase
MVRVMPGEAEVVREGQRGLIQLALAKKLEGNSNHPVNRGKLCARGEAGLQLTYHPDRIKNPLKRSGPRGAGAFQAASWDEAVNELVGKLKELQSQNHPDQLRLLSGRLRGQRAALVAKFLQAFGAPPMLTFDPLDEPVLRRANALSFGHGTLPTFDLAHASYVISLGADFLGTWNSPVAQSIGYGEMRQGQEGKRGKLVQVEQRISYTGANADEWIFAPPGMEGFFALSLAHIILRDNLRPKIDDAATRLIPGWHAQLADYAPENVANQMGIPAARLERIAHELASHLPGIVMIGGAALAQTNGLFSALAVDALNSLLGSVGAPGGIYFSPRFPLAEVEEDSAPASSGDQLAAELSKANVLLLYGANPIFAGPPAWNIPQALEKVPFIVSFGIFVDETNCFADLILPDHSPLESWLDDVPETGSSQAVVTIAPPVMSPLHNTRSMPDLLLALAHQIGGRVAEALPAENFEQMLKASVAPLQKNGPDSALDPDKFWAKIQRQGGWWSEGGSPKSNASKVKKVALESIASRFDGEASAFPFYFQPYISQAFLDGSLAHLPWLQELPDVLSTAMWGAWVEVNPRTAAALGIVQGDLLEVRSQHGKLQAPVLVAPGIAPDLIAMPFGQGHTNFSRYARGRGANPMSLLAPLQVDEVGSLAWAATRVAVSKVGKAQLAMFSGGLFERPPELEQR